MEFIPYEIFNVLITFYSFYRMFKKTRNCILIGRDLVCGMIVSSENVTPKNLQPVMDLQRENKMCVFSKDEIF